MANYITFFPVDNGDMTLIKTRNDVNVLIDCNIRDSSTNEDIYDCNTYLHDNLPKDSEQLFIDAFFLTHSDNDHCRGIKEYFNLCSPDELDDEKIRIDELFVPAKLMIDDTHYNDDADAIRDEAQRRLNLLGNDESNIRGNRVKIIGYSAELKEYSDIIIPSGESISSINGNDDYGAEFFVLRPVKKDTDNEDTSVNECTSSFKIDFKIDNSTYVAIIGGDLVCDNWKEVIELNPEMTFDLLLAPHHCSWHAISNEDTHTGKADEIIEDFLEKSKDKAYVVSSSKKIKRDSDNPPSYRAKSVYIKHLKDAEKFKCTAEYPNTDNPQPITFKITSQGVSISPIKTIAKKNNMFTQKSYG